MGDVARDVGGRDRTRSTLDRSWTRLARSLSAWTEHIGLDDAPARDAIDRVIADGTPKGDDAVAVVTAAADALGAVVRAYQEPGERWWQATAELDADLDAPLDLARLDLVRRAADQARSASRADATAVLVRGTRDQALELVASSGAAPEEVLPLGLTDSTVPVIEAVLGTGAPRLVADEGSDTESSERGRLLLLPFRDGGQVEGVLVLAWNAAHRHEADVVPIPAAERFADRLGSGLRSLGAAKHREHLTLLLERERLGRDLHDVVVQRLFGVGLALQSLAGRQRVGVLDETATEGLMRAVDDIDSTIRVIRRAIFELELTEPSADLRSEVSAMVQRAGPLLKIRPTLTLEGEGWDGLERRVADDVLAVVQESLSNVAQHAGATTVSVRLSITDVVTVVVEDDGAGMTPGAPRNGLHHLRRRAEEHGGHLTIRSGRGQGTTIEWVVPVGAAG